MNDMATHQITNRIVQDSLEAGYIIRAQTAYVADPAVRVIDIPSEAAERETAFRYAMYLSQQGEYVIAVDPSLGRVPEWFATASVSVTEAWIDSLPQAHSLSMVARLSKIGDYLTARRADRATSADPNPCDHEDPRNW